MNNYHNFMRLHPTIEVNTFALVLLKKKNLIDINHIVIEYKNLEQDHPWKYAPFRKVLLSMLEKSMALLAQNQQPSALLEAIGIGQAS